MAGKAKPFSDSVLENLDPEVYEHFRYQKLFRNEIKSSDKEAVDNYLIKEYLNGKTPEEFVMAHITENITKEMSKFSIRKNDSADNKPASSGQSKTAGNGN